MHRSLIAASCLAVGLAAVPCLAGIRLDPGSLPLTDDPDAATPRAALSNGGELLVIWGARTERSKTDSIRGAWCSVGEARCGSSFFVVEPELVHGSVEDVDLFFAGGNRFLVTWRWSAGAAHLYGRYMRVGERHWVEPFMVVPDGAERPSRRFQVAGSRTGRFVAAWEPKATWDPVERIERTELRVWDLARREPFPLDLGLWKVPRAFRAAIDPSGRAAFAVLTDALGPTDPPRARWTSYLVVQDAVGGRPLYTKKLDGQRILHLAFLSDGLVLAVGRHEAHDQDWSWRTYDPSGKQAGGPFALRLNGELVAVATNGRGESLVAFRSGGSGEGTQRLLHLAPDGSMADSLEIDVPGRLEDLTFDDQGTFVATYDEGDWKTGPGGIGIRIGSVSSSADPEP